MCASAIVTGTVGMKADKGRVKHAREWHAKVGSANDRESYSYVLIGCVASDGL